MILVTGATGNVGRELVEQLVEAGERVRAVMRKPADAARLPTGAEPVVADLNRPESLTDALQGVSGMHLLAGYDGLERLLADASSAGVRHVVLQSSSSVPTGDLDNAVAAYHIRSEQAIRDSGLDWTFLRPNTFMTNTLQWADAIRADDPVRAPFPDVAVSTIDPADIAAVAVAALTDGARHAGAAYRLSGPRALTPADRARILGEVLEREELSAAMPEPYVDAMFSFFVAGTVDETTVHPTVEAVLGRPARSFAQWAEAHADAFR